MGESIAGANGQTRYSTPQADPLTLAMEVAPGSNADWVLDSNDGAPTAPSGRAGFSYTGSEDGIMAMAQRAANRQASANWYATGGMPAGAPPTSYTAQAGDGPLAIADGIDPTNRYAIAALIAGSGQASYSASANRWITTAGQTYNGDLSSLSADQIAQLDRAGRQLTSTESSIDSRREALRQAQAAQAATYRNENYGNEGRSRPTYSSSSYDDMSWLSRRGNAVETAASTTALQGIYDEYGLMTNPAAAPIGQVVAGVMFGGARVLAEPVMQVGDLLQVANEMGRSLVTGEGPRDIGYMSMVGQASGQGATTAQIANGGMYSLLKTPDRIIENLQKGDYYAAGEDIGGVGVGLGFAAAGAPRGSGQNFVVGSRLAMEDSFAVAGSLVDDAFRPISPRTAQRGSVSVDLLTGRLLPDSAAATGANSTSRAFKTGEDVIHFEKHGSEIARTLGYENYSLGQYVQDANSVIANGTFAPELNAYVSIPGGTGSAKGLMVGLDRATGEITTMHMKPVSWFETKAPSLGWEAQSKTVRTNTVGPNPQSGWKWPY